MNTLTKTPSDFVSTRVRKTTHKQMKRIALDLDISLTQLFDHMLVVMQEDLANRPGAQL
jgi:hypothetical protein